MIRLFRRLLDRIQERTERSPTLRLIKPLVEATDSFFFTKPDVTEGPPHLRDRIDVKRYMSMVILGLTPAVIGSVYFFGWRMLLIILVTYAAGGLTEIVFAIIRKEEINEGFLVTGMLFPLTLPPLIPLWVVVIGVVAGVIFGKEIFGGTGKNFFNPALVGRCFIAICFPVQMTAPDYWSQNAATLGPAGGFAVWQAPALEPDAYTSATPLIARKSVVAGKIPADKLPSGWEMFVGTKRGSVGETSALLLIVGGLLIVAARIASWEIVLSCFAGGMLYSWVMHEFVSQKFADPIFTVLAGGYMLGAFFMATDPVSAPSQRTAKFIYGALIGVLTVTIRSISGYVEGMMFAILLMNVFAPIIDDIVINRRYGKPAIG